MRPSQHRSTLATVLLAAGLVVVGCSTEGDRTDAPEPAPSDSAAQPTPADSAQQGPAEPEGVSAQGQQDEDLAHFEAHLTMVERPPEMERADEAGATSAAEYFLFAYTYAYGTGDTGPLEQLSGPECGFCDSAIAGAQQAHAGQTYMRSGDPVITDVGSGPGEEPEVDYLVWFDVRLPQMRTFDADHAVVEVHPASDLEAGFAMAHDGGQWLVLGATLAEAS